MSDETRDPREAVLMASQGMDLSAPKNAIALLRALDAADPRLAMWGELVALLNEAHAPFGDMHARPDSWVNRKRELLTRARAIDATIQGGDDAR